MQFYILLDGETVEVDAREGRGAGGAAAVLGGVVVEGGGRVAAVPQGGCNAAEEEAVDTREGGEGGQQGHDDREVGCEDGFGGIGGCGLS